MRTRLRQCRRRFTWGALTALSLVAGCRPYEPAVSPRHPASPDAPARSDIPPVPEVLDVARADRRAAADYPGVPLHPELPEMKHHAHDAASD